MRTFAHRFRTCTGLSWSSFSSSVFSQRLDIPSQLPTQLLATPPRASCATPSRRKHSPDLLLLLLLVLLPPPPLLLLLLLLLRPGSAGPARAAPRPLPRAAGVCVENAYLHLLHISIHLSIYPSIYLSIHLPIHLVLARLSSHWGGRPAGAVGPRYVCISVVPRLQTPQNTFLAISGVLCFKLIFQTL